MKADTEKALLKYIGAEAHFRAYPGSTDDYVREAARAYLATLEPKPEPKRGVEQYLERILECGLNRCFVCSNETREALRLYREERERVENYRGRVGQVATTLRKRCLTDGPISTFIRQQADELERRDAD